MTPFRGKSRPCTQKGKPTISVSLPGLRWNGHVRHAKKRPVPVDGVPSWQKYLLRPASAPVAFKDTDYGCFAPYSLSKNLISLSNSGFTWQKKSNRHRKDEGGFFLPFGGGRTSFWQAVRLLRAVFGLRNHLPSKALSAAIRPKTKISAQALPPRRLEP